MPRFLNTWTGDFEWHDPTKVRYAILSHTWRLPEDGGEQSYDDIQALQAAAKAHPLHILQPAILSGLSRLGSLRRASLRHKSSPILPVAHLPPFTILSHPKLSEKIKGVCMVAREAGYRLIWIDSCCIDKSSSAELSEAINSMFEWYRLSDVCYVYLADVSDDDDPMERGSSFWKSRWHRRSWTLQELIAPAHVEFLTDTWRSLGTKLGLAITLETITGVDFKILTGHATVDSISVAHRMSWAVEREATRIEDTAYSLMGLFNIHMSPIYGEGMNAFLRLQEEIVRTIPDQSIFAWGSSCTLRSLSKPEAVEYTTGPAVSTPSGLYAGSPRDFMGCRDITPISSSHFASIMGLRRREDVPSLHCISTPQGVHVQLLYLDVAKIPQFLETFWRELRLDQCLDCMGSQAGVFVFLRCQDEHGSLVSLPLCRPHDGTEPTRGLFIGTHLTCARFWHVSHRTIRMTQQELMDYLVHVSPTRFDEPLLRHYSGPNNVRCKWYLQSSLPSDLFARRDRALEASFHITPRNIDTLRSLGFTIDFPLKVAHPPESKQVTVQITLRTHMQGLARDRGGRPQTIEITLSLDQPPSGTSMAYKPGSIGQVHAFVENFGEVPTGRLAPDPPHSLAVPRILISSPSMEKTREWFGDDRLHGRPSPCSSQSPWTHIDSDTEVVLRVHSGTPLEDEEEIRKVRLLRVALFRRLDASYPPKHYEEAYASDKAVYVSIDISEPCQHNQWIARTTEETRQMSSVGQHPPAVALHHWQSNFGLGLPPPAAPPSPRSVHPEGASEAVGDLAPVYPREQENTLQRENDTLRGQTSLMSSQIAELTSKNTELESRMTTMMSQMATVLARLESLPNASQVVRHSAYAEARYIALPRLTTREFDTLSSLSRRARST